MTIDDVRNGMGSRVDARTHVDKLLKKSHAPLTAEQLEAQRLEDEAQKEIDDEKAREEWGTSEEAIAAQSSSFWDS
jgi:hypothetical protein